MLSFEDRFNQLLDEMRDAIVCSNHHGREAQRLMVSLDNEEHSRVKEAFAEAEEYAVKIGKCRKALYSLAIGREEYERQYAEWEADAKGYAENADR